MVMLHQKLIKMKKILLVFGIFCGAAFAVNAQDTTSTQSNRYQTQSSQDQDNDKDKKEISVAQLPSTVQQQLQSSDYTAWTVDKVYRKEKDGQPMYMVELKKGDEMKKIKFDAQGNVIKEKEKKDHDQK
jgi:uncharacterized membrane protein YkoI